MSGAHLALSPILGEFNIPVPWQEVQTCLKVFSPGSAYIAVEKVAPRAQVNQKGRYIFFMEVSWLIMSIIIIYPNSEKRVKNPKKTGVAIV
jgi:hypothetical protein